MHSPVTFLTYLVQQGSATFFILRTGKKNGNLFANRLSKTQMFSIKNVSQLQWGTTANSNFRFLIDDILALLLQQSLIIAVFPENWNHFITRSCKYIPKYLTWKSIRPGNKLSTDRWLPNTAVKIGIRSSPA